MHKLAAIIAASAFAFGSVSGFAQDTAKKKEELTNADRAEMRNRAEKLRAERTGHQPAPRAERSTQPAAQGKAPAVQTATAKPTELTQEERAEMRNRAERLQAERARAVTR